jgi:hypothetical protein
MNKDNNIFFGENNKNEQILLKNNVKTKGILGLKNRFAILSNYSLLIFEDQDKFIKGKNPRVNNTN